MKMIRIEREALDALGGQEAFDAAIAQYADAMSKHAKTVGVPAPAAPHPWVERIVKFHGGKYDVVEPMPEKTPAVPFAEMKERKFTALSQKRLQVEYDGIDYGGSRLRCDPMTINALTSAILNGEEIILWKFGRANFTEITRETAMDMLSAIRRHVQMCFDHEHELAQRITAARGFEALAAIDIGAGW